VTLSGDVTATSTAAGVARIEGNLSVGNVAGRVFTVSDGPAAVDLLVSAAITGFLGAGMTKEGPGKMELSAANTSYTGATTVNAGTLRISNGQALGPASAPPGTTVNAGATLELFGSNLNFSNSVPEPDSERHRRRRAGALVIWADPRPTNAQLTGSSPSPAHHDRTDRPGFPGCRRWWRRADQDGRLVPVPPRQPRFDWGDHRQPGHPGGR
jgi:autotransporter-associated beta strand protein